MQSWRVIKRLTKIKNSKTPVGEMNNRDHGNLSDFHKKKYSYNEARLNWRKPQKMERKGQ